MKLFNFFIGESGLLPDFIKERLKKIVPLFKKRQMILEEFEGGFSIYKKEARRSIDANSFYWGVVIPAVRKYRYNQGDPVSNECCHEDLILDFSIDCQRRTLKGIRYTTKKRTKDMTRAEFNDYLTAIIATLAQFGVSLPAREYEQ